MVSVYDWSGVAFSEFLSVDFLHTAIPVYVIYTRHVTNYGMHTAQRLFGYVHKTEKKNTTI